MKKILLALALIVACITIVFAKKPNKPVQEKMPEEHKVVDIGYPVIGVADEYEDGKVSPAIYKGIVLMLRDDGVVCWRLSDELKKRFEKDMKEGKLKTIPFKTQEFKVK